MCVCDGDFSCIIPPLNGDRFYEWVSSKDFYIERDWNRVVNKEVPLQELELRPKTLRERHQRNRTLNTCENCPTDGRDVTGRWRNRPGSIKARAVEPASAFVIQQPLCVCLSISVGAYFCWLCLTDTQDELHDSYKCKVILALGECGSHYRLCVPPCKRKAFSAGDTHSLCVVCLRAGQAESALEGADCPCKNKKRHCVLALGGVLWVRAFTCILHGAGPFRGEQGGEQGGALAALVGIADGSGRHEDGWVLIFFFSHQIQRPLSGFGSPPCGSFPPERGLDALPAFLRGGGCGGRRWAL